MENLTPDQLFEQNQDLAMWVAQKFHCNEGFEDIKQLALIGLFKAAQRFDAEKGFSFSTYAVPTIRNEIIRNHFEQKHSIKIPRRILENAVKVKRHLKHTEDVNTLSELTGLSVKAVNMVLEYLSHKTYSLDYELGKHGESSLGEMIGGYEENWDELIMIKDFMATLDEREKVILEMRINGCPQTEIGEALNISQVHASRLLKKMKTKFQQHIA